MTRSNLIAILFIASDLLILVAVLLQLLIRQEVLDLVGERQGFRDFDYARRVAEAYRQRFPRGRMLQAASLMMWVGSAMFLACAVLWLSRFFLH